MKFIHLGDLHLGKSLCDYNLIEDQTYALSQIVDLVEQENIDGVLIAGDVYDKAIPSEESVRLFNSFIEDLAMKKKAVFIISGNHDSDERLNFGSSLFENSHVYIASKFDGRLYKRTLEDEYGRINIYLLPFVKASVVKHYYPDEKIENYNDAVRCIIEHSDIDANERNVIVAHQFVVGTSDEIELGGSEGLATKSVGTVELISYEVFNQFDYVALGHIHRPQRVGRDNVRYSGSLLKYSLSEEAGKKSIPIVNFSKQVDIDLISIKPLRELRHIKGELVTILDKSNVVDANDYIYVTLTNEDTVTDAIGIIRQYYPNTIKVDYCNSHTMEIEAVNYEGFSHKQSFEEIVGAFYQMMYGTEIAEEEMAVMKSVAKEAGIIHETN